MALQSTDPRLPNYACPEYMAAVPDLVRMQDVLGGTRSMQTNATKYIKQWPREALAIYLLRRVCAMFFDGTLRTLSSAVGMLFAKPPEIVWGAVEDTLAPIWANLDAAGTAGPILQKRRAHLALRDGLALSLTDHTSAPPGVEINAGNQDRYNLRPKVALYPRLSVPNWLVETINNQSVLTSVTLVETGRVRVGLFGIGSVTRYRVLSLVPVVDGAGQATPDYQASWVLYEHNEQLGDKPEAFSVHSEGTFRSQGGAVADFLPIEIAYAGHTEAPMTADIPFLGVANANIEHWEIATDIRWYEKMCAYPQRVVKGRLLANANGETPTELPAGPGHAIQVEETGDVRWDELSGTSITQLKESRQQKKTEMGEMGAGFLLPDKRAAETAEAHRLDAIAEQSTLITAGQGIEDADNLMLEHVCWFLDIAKADAPTVSINTDFEGRHMSAQEEDSNTRTAIAGIISKRTALQRLITGERLPPDFDVEAELSRLQSEAPDMALLDPAGGAPIPDPTAAAADMSTVGAAAGSAAA